MLDTRIPACADQGLYQADDGDPLNWPHSAHCAVLATPTPELTEETCDCRGDA